jgi:mono/diheme cytochrome c family protein
VSPRIAVLAFLLASPAFFSGTWAAEAGRDLPPSWAETEAKKYPYLNNRPMGSPQSPLVQRTFLPNPGLDPAVLGNHRSGAKALGYNPEKGVDLSKDVMPIDGIPAGIAVNYGANLSFVFDTTEGRLLYAWQGGFLDMFPYWGDSITRGAMVQMDYLPRLIGRLFYRASGSHPVEIDGRSVTGAGAPRFLGYELDRGQPIFAVRHGAHTLTTRVVPDRAGVRLEFSVEPVAQLSFRREDDRYSVNAGPTGAGTLSVTLTGVTLGEFNGYERALKLTEASIAAGRQLYQNYGCASCHNLNGSRSNGPSHIGLFGREETLLDGTAVKVDEAYLLESIKDPNAKIPRGYAANVMPPYNQLGELEYRSLILFIKSLVQPEQASAETP